MRQPTLQNSTPMATSESGVSHWCRKRGKCAYRRPVQRERSWPTRTVTPSDRFPARPPPSGGSLVKDGNKSDGSSLVCASFSLARLLARSLSALPATRGNPRRSGASSPCCFYCCTASPASNGSTKHYTSTACSPLCW